MQRRDNQSFNQGDNDYILQQSDDKSTHQSADDVPLMRRDEVEDKEESNEDGIRQDEAEDEKEYSEECNEEALHAYTAFLERQVNELQTEARGSHVASMWLDMHQYTLLALPLTRYQSV
ncbi:uncharacterized protein BDZ99DRAFT_479691 [Mytilinidion resinicola]|uniref:Uncharacterized protein n=1 Tax=Mytilinidion resinicola TaxID=574789 RepID=A0A6A6YCW3_9PEZI|nr:uncharacterized protein BDZ99DRAFT_479691 [Mytilinidion resinicola]KAF2806439.1 hypothetical protein BDZ99DRAFT_479691 [Mytilinidion resinicola]